MTRDEIMALEGHAFAATVATDVMGWELIDVDYEVSSDAESLSYQSEKDAYKWVSPEGHPDILCPPSHAKWYGNLVEQGIESVGLYWGDPSTYSIIYARDFRPHEDWNDTMRVWDEVSKWSSDRQLIFGKHLYQLIWIRTGHRAIITSTSTLNVTQADICRAALLAVSEGGE